MDKNAKKILKAARLRLEDQKLVLKAFEVDRVYRTHPLSQEPGQYASVIIFKEDPESPRWFDYHYPDRYEDKVIADSEDPKRRMGDKPIAAFRVDPKTLLIEYQYVEKRPERAKWGILFLRPELA